jgi:hypothetical protein
MSKEVILRCEGQHLSDNYDGKRCRRIGAVSFKIISMFIVLMGCVQLTCRPTEEE